MKATASVVAVENVTVARRRPGLRILPTKKGENKNEGQRRHWWRFIVMVMAVVEMWYNDGGGVGTG